MDDLLDDLGDLGDVMGDDYQHGYDDSKGDPNVKPKPAKGPTEDESKRSSSTLRVVFPPQQQFLTKLVVQAMPLLNVVNRGAGVDPFSEFATTPDKGGQQITAEGEATDASYADFSGLMPGMPYVFRLKCTNPAGTTTGKNSKPVHTIPAAPPAPTFLHAKASSIFIRFPENSRGGKQQIQKLTIGVAKAGPADPFAPKNKPGAMTDGTPNSATLKQARIQKLAPGTLYVFRITVENKAGKAVGAVSAPMLTVPGPPSRLREDSKHRKDDQVMLKFAKHGQHLTHLMVQYAILQGSKKTFDELMKDPGSKTESIPNPQTATSFLVKKLTGNSKYVFRLAAKNKSGHTIGTVLGPITTVEHAPEMLDKSGWMTEVPVAAGKKKSGLARRLSSRSAAKGQKYWYVIDGRLLNWFSDIKMQDEVGFLHLSKLKRITYVPDKDGQARVFSLLLKTGQKITLECASSDPNLTTHDYTMGWMSSIQRALSGMQKSMAEFKKEEAGKKKEGRRASIKAADEDELEDDEDVDFGDGAEKEDGFDMEAEGFGDDGEEDGFGDGFGGFGEGDDEDDDFGGGGEDEEEDDDDFGGDGDFGGFEAEMVDSDAELEDGEVEVGDDDFGGFADDDEEDDDFGGFE